MRDSVYNMQDNPKEGMKQAVRNNQNNLALQYSRQLIDTLDDSIADLNKKVDALKKELAAVKKAAAKPAAKKTAAKKPEPEPTEES